MRTIGVVTVARSDYGIYLPILRRIEAEPDLNLRLYVSGMHLSPEFGLTVRAIEEDGFPIAERIETLLSSDSPEGVAKSMALGIAGFAQAFARGRPDILVVLGDRFEMYSAAVAALPFKVPVAHIHGGEVTEGAMDEAFRHSMTKLSHLHFVATSEYARRVRQLGEEPWRVVVCGAPSLDNLKSMPVLSRADIRGRFGIDLPERFLLVTYHPVTLEYEQVEWQVGELLAALDSCGVPALFTLPNADQGGRAISHLLEAYVAAHPDSRLVSNLGTVGYFNAMRLASAMVGNSSSGIIEAPSLQLPVVNIGNRQRGRIRAPSTIDVGYGREEIADGIQRALSPVFREGLRDVTNPYGGGCAAEVIAGTLRDVALDDGLVLKRFHDLPIADLTVTGELARWQSVGKPNSRFPSPAGQ